MLKFATTITMSALAYIGAVIVLATVMPNDWRVFFISLLPMFTVIYFAYREEKIK